MLRNDLDSITQLLAQICRDAEMEEAPRRAALELLVTIAGAGKSMARKLRSFAPTVGR
jgi:hypothetical protein